MNERIQELAISTGIYDSLCDPYDSHNTGDAHSSVMDDLEKFAELIIRECVQTLHNNTPVLDENESLEDWNKGYIRAMLDCEHHITEHFGVE
jgi:hypothetical protein